MAHEPDGFSLIELMAALAILALSAVAAYPSYLDSARKARRAEGRAALMQAMQQQERQFSRTNAYAPFSAAAANGFKWFSGASPAASAYELSGAACPDDTVENCILLTAAPGTAMVNGAFRDDACGSLTLSSNGTQAASGGAAHCW